MKIVLIQPPVRDFYETDIRLQPIGLCYIKSTINKFIPGAEVLIRDYHAGHGRRTVPLPEELSYLKPYYPVADASPFSTFHQYYHFGQSFEDIEAEIAGMNPDLVGISSLFTPYWREALQIAERVKRRLNVPVIMGGPHVSEAPEEVLALPCVDYVIIGEGERPMVEFVRFLKGEARREDVPNLGYRRDGRICFNHLTGNYPIEELPEPDLSCLPAERYQFAGRPLAFMITSRGCPHRCSFCSVHATFGHRYRRRPLDSIIKEIEQRYREGSRVIDFEDDNLTFHKDECRELCRRLIELFPEREMEFTAMNGISYMSLDDELLELMRRAGFSHLNLSLVSLDSRLRGHMKRPHSIEAYGGVVHKAFDLGFRIVSYQILGLPGERKESMVQTMAYHTRLPVLLGVSPFYLTPGMPLAGGRKLAEADCLRARLSALAPDSDLFSREDIYTLFVTARIINFLKGLEIQQSCAINDLMERSWESSRVDMGIELLRDLRQGRALSFMTSQGKVINKKFKTDIFRQVIREAGHLTCQNGMRIELSGFFIP